MCFPDITSEPFTHEGIKLNVRSLRFMVDSRIPILVTHVDKAR